MLPAPTIDPLAAEIAALAEKRKTRVAVVCKFKAESFPGVPGVRSDVTRRGRDLQTRNASS